MKNNILIIDDSIEILLLLKNILESEGYRTTTLSSSKAALEHIKENPNNYDLILIDIVMPDLDGMELMKEINSTFDIGNIPHIFISAKNELFLKKLTAYDPESIFIQKPIDKIELLEKIKGII